MAMDDPGNPVARFDFRRGALRGSHLALYSASLVHRGGAEIDVIAIGGVAAVRVAYERDERKLAWGVFLAVLALAVFAVSGLLVGLAGSAAADIASRMRTDVPPAGQGIVGTLHATFLFLQALAEGFPVAAAALMAWAIALLAFGVFGTTTLALTVAAGERTYTVPGRDTRLFDFAELVANALTNARR